MQNDCNEILAPQREHPTNIKNTFHFVSGLSKISLSSTHMASFDAISLFTNIPLDFAINLVLQKSTLTAEWRCFTALTKLNSKSC